MTIVLRQATHADTDYLRDMLYYAIFVPADAQPPPRDIVDTPQLIPYVRGFGTQAGDIGVIAEDATQPVGAAWVRLMRGYGTRDAGQRDALVQQAVNDVFDMIGNDAPGGIIHELATTGGAGVFRFSDTVRTIFDHLVGMTVRAAAHDIPPRFKDLLLFHATTQIQGLPRL